jgi:hypothetical protein
MLTIAFVLFSVQANTLGRVRILKRIKITTEQTLLIKRSKLSDLGNAASTDGRRELNAASSLSVHWLLSGQTTHKDGLLQYIL